MFRAGGGARVPGRVGCQPAAVCVPPAVRGGSSETQLRSLIQAGVIPPLCVLLRPEFPLPTILRSVSALNRFVTLGLSDAIAADLSVNPVAEAVDACGGYGLLELLQHNHPNDEAVIAATAAFPDNGYTPGHGILDEIPDFVEMVNSLATMFPH